MKNLIHFILVALFTLSCNIEKGAIAVRLKGELKSPGSFSLANVQVINHQFVLTGTNLSHIKSVKIKEGATETLLTIESKTATQIVANTLSNVTLAAGKVFSFILADAGAANTFTVNFSLCDSDLNGKGFNCSVTPNDKDVLSYDAVSQKWIPRNINGLTYKGTFSAAGGIVPPGSPDAGDYYIISGAGTINSVSYAVGDWISYSGDEWQKIANARNVLSVYGRTGNITAREGDYSLDKLSDVTLGTPNNGDFLKFNGTAWVPAAVVTTESDPNVSAFAKTTLPTCGAGQVLKSDGTNFSCVTDATGAGAFTGTASRAVVTDGTGALAVSSITSTVLGYLSGVTSDIQTQLDSKASSSAVVDWSTAGLQTLEPTRINLTTANRVVVTNGSAVPTTSAVTATELGYVSGVTSGIQSQIGNLQDQIDDIVAGATGTWAASGSNVYRSSGNVGIGTTTPDTLLTIKEASTGTTSIKVLNTLGNTSAEISTTVASNAMLRLNKANGTLTTLLGTDPSASPFIYSDASAVNRVDGIVTGYGAGLAIRVPYAVNQENGIFFQNGGISDPSGGAITFYTTSTANYGRGGLKFKTSANGSLSTRMTIDQNGNLGIGTTTPSAKLQVEGQVVSTTYNNGSSLTFDMNNGNNQYTSASCGATTLNNVLNGAAYTIVVQGSTSGTCTFTATGYTFKFSPANGATTANSHTVYSMQVIGTVVYVSWISGF